MVWKMGVFETQVWGGWECWVLSPGEAGAWGSRVR